MRFSAALERSQGFSPYIKNTIFDGFAGCGKTLVLLPISPVAHDGEYVRLYRLRKN
jgi:hypothetical protein